MFGTMASAHRVARDATRQCRRVGQRFEANLSLSWRFALPATIPPNSSSFSGCLGVDALCKELGLSRVTVYRWVKADPISGVTVPLPSRKVGRRIFFLASEVQEWLRLYGPQGLTRVEDHDDDAPPVPSGKIERKARKGAR
jgi:predicted DNA-binding transcriptional regulator AlpA